MKRIFKSLMFIAVAAITFASCKQELATVQPEEGNFVTVYLGVENPSITKANFEVSADDKTFTPSWSDNDEITVSYINYTTETEGDAVAAWNTSLNKFGFQISESALNDLEAEAANWGYSANYPKEENPAFGNERTQHGQNYASEYDMMVGSLDAESIFGKNGEKDLIIPMVRQTAILYFHLTASSCTFDEPITKATLTVGDGEVIAASTIKNSPDGAVPANGAETFNFIELSVEDGVAINSEDGVKLWFNVLPVVASSLTLTVESENYTCTISNTGGDVYLADHLYKIAGNVAGKWAAKPTSCTVTWMVNGEEYLKGSPSASVDRNAKVTVLPTVPADIAGKKFVGWTTSEDYSNKTTAPSDLFNTVEESPTIMFNTIFYAVYATKSGGSYSLAYGWEEEESSSSSFTNTFLNTYTRTGVSAHGGDKYGANVNSSNNGVAGNGCSIKTNIKVPATKVSFYYTRTSSNTTTQNWVLKTSTNNSTWSSNSNTFLASDTNISVGSWEKAEWSLDGSEVYIQITMSANGTAIRAIDDLVIEYGNGPITYSDYCTVISNDTPIGENFLTSTTTIADGDYYIVAVFGGEDASYTGGATYLDLEYWAASGNVTTLSGNSNTKRLVGVDITSAVTLNDNGKISVDKNSTVLTSSMVYNIQKDGSKYILKQGSNIIGCTQKAADLTTTSTYSWQTLKVVGQRVQVEYSYVDNSTTKYRYLYFQKKASGSNTCYFKNYTASTFNSVNPSDQFGDGGLYFIPVSSSK